MGLLAKLTAQSDMKHVVEYKFMGRKQKEVHGSYQDAQSVMKDLEKNKDFSNITYRTATK